MSSPMYGPHFDDAMQAVDSRKMTREQVIALGQTMGECLDAYRQLSEIEHASKSVRELAFVQGSVAGFYLLLNSGDQGLTCSWMLVAVALLTVCSTWLESKRQKHWLLARQKALLELCESLPSKKPTC